MALPTHQFFRFGRFELDEASRALTKDGRAVRLGSRAFDILVALLSRAGEIVSKDELIAAVWPNLHVEENNLRVHLTALRKALDEAQAEATCIANIPGRGYSFVAPVTRIDAAVPVPSEHQAPRHNLPLIAGQVFGRSTLVDTLAGLLAERRMVTIVGPGGIGKTTVALQVAERQLAVGKTVAFADLAPLSDPLLAFGVIASALDCPIRSNDPAEDLIGYIVDRDCCIVFDGCEHVVDRVARQVEILLARCRNLQILATSREPLRIPEEWVHRIAPLESPNDIADVTAAEALRFPAIQLFAERAAASMGGYVLTDTDAPFAVDICRRLGGVALAIELAAARVGAVGVRGLANALVEPARLLAQSRRGGIERHRSLHAALEWSYETLTPVEKAVFRRCAVFNGGLSLEAARAVAADDAFSAEAVEDAVFELVEKSLLIADIAQESIQYRMMEITRAYALERLQQEGERRALERKHAEYFRGFFERAAHDWEALPAKEWLGRTAPQIDNLRRALDWSYSAEGDVDIGGALTVAAMPLWLSLSLIDECLVRVKRALEALERQPEPDARMQMQLYAALGWPQMALVTEGGGTPSWRMALAIAEKIGDLDYQLRALWALWVDSKNVGRPRDGLAFADRIIALATEGGQYADRLIGERLRGASLHLLGRHEEARQAIERMLAEYRPPANRAHIVRFQFDQETTARNTLARVLWVQGFGGRALQEIDENVRRAVALEHKLSLSNVLAESACPVAFMEGDLDLCERLVAQLRRETQAQALDVWSTYADAFGGDLLIRRGHTASGLALLRPAIQKLRRTNFVFHLTAFLSAMATGLSEIGQWPQALELIEEGLARCAETGEAWYLPELLRAKGEIMVAGGDAQGIASLEQAIAVARDQGAAGWEARAAASLSRAKNLLAAR
jgi:predicted ATPase/DNA-binding winged helix-turn-helix (wHTH) protein